MYGCYVSLFFVGHIKWYFLSAMFFAENLAVRGLQQGESFMHELNIIAKFDCSYLPM